MHAIAPPPPPFDAAAFIGACRDAPAPPLRQLTRLRAEMSVAGTQKIQPVFGDWRSVIEYNIVAKVCLPDWRRGRELAVPASPSRAISSRRLAASLGASPETTRRHLHALCERGLIEMVADGFRLGTAGGDACYALVHLSGVHDHMVQLAADVLATSDLRFHVARAPRFAAGDVIDAMLATTLVPTDLIRPMGLSLHAINMWSALTAMAVRRVTFDPVLARRFANSIPTDDVRSSVSLRRFAAALGLPYATAWRHLRELDEAGMVSKVGAKWTVLSRNLQAPNQKRLSSAPSTVLYNKLRELAALGFDPAEAADYYRLGPPARANLGVDPLP